MSAVQTRNLKQNVRDFFLAIGIAAFLFMSDIALRAMTS